MSAPVVVLVVLGAGLLLLLGWRLRGARPAVPPLALDPDDPLMREAVRKARDALPRFRELLDRPHAAAHVKVRFVSSTDETEYLWAELRLLGENEVEVLYTTPPVTHRGRLERIQKHPLTDVVDWQVETAEGLYEGGFSMLAMFERAREQWGSLPPELEAEERRYRTGARTA